MTLRDWLLIILIGAIWGCSFLFNAILIRELGPIWVSALRVTVGALGCWAYFVATRRSLPREPVLYLQFLILGVLNYAIPFALFPLAEQDLPSGLVGVINALTPLMTVVVSHFWRGGEKATLNKSMGVLVGFVGAAILASPSLSGGSSNQLWAIGACLLATLCYAFTLNYARRLRSIDPTTIAACSLTAAAIVSVPFGFIFEGIPTITRIETWGALLGIGLLSSSFAFLLMYRMLPRVGATNFSINTFITPISAILLGVLVLHERFETVHMIGMAVIFLGLLLLDGRILKLGRRVAA
ncbi:drug/metabolite transporter (DMT)-like permease [Devosia sp. UYZn731]|uniref:DMT family transporter n=1 Tax=Devosia sp. UYZn731 TaxID=3156345 RepID=UPI003396B06C